MMHSNLTALNGNTINSSSALHTNNNVGILNGQTIGANNVVSLFPVGVNTNGNNNNNKNVPGGGGKSMLAGTATNLPSSPTTLATTTAVRLLDSGGECGGEDSNGNSNQLQVILTIRMLMQGKEVGSIIGRKGDYIKQIREQSAAKINISDGSCPERIVTISGTIGTIDRAFTMVAGKLEDDLQSLPATVASKPPITLRLIVPASQCGSLIGKGGSKIREIRDKTGASLQVANELLCNSTEKAVTISGSSEALIGCMREVCQILLDAPAKGPTIQYKPANTAYNPLAMVNSAANIAAAAAHQKINRGGTMGTSMAGAGFPLGTNGVALPHQQSQLLTASGGLISPGMAAAIIAGANPLQAAQLELALLQQQQQQQVNHPFVDVSRFLLPPPINNSNSIAQHYGTATNTSTTTNPPLCPTTIAMGMQMPAAHGGGGASSQQQQQQQQQQTAQVLSASQPLLAGTNATLLAAMNPAALLGPTAAAAAAGGVNPNGGHPFVVGTPAYHHYSKAQAGGSGIELYGLDPVTTALLALQQQQQNNGNAVAAVDFNTAALYAQYQQQQQKQQQQQQSDLLLQQQQLFQQHQQQQLQLLYQQQQQQQQAEIVAPYAVAQGTNSSNHHLTGRTMGSNGKLIKESGPPAVAAGTAAVVTTAAAAVNAAGIQHPPTTNGKQKQQQRFTPY